MQAVKLKATITADHTLEVLLPKEIPQCEAEVIIMYDRQDKAAEEGGMLAFLELLDGQNYPRRSGQEIMAYLEKERASWDREA
ncbi:MAG: hypothetical protein Q9M26_08865 [Mariprofundales bacterium]|nr:hypothetical protein [Mariprofundales bacterium]